MKIETTQNKDKKQVREKAFAYRDSALDNASNNKIKEENSTEIKRRSLKVLGKKITKKIIEKIKRIRVLNVI